MSAYKIICEWVQKLSLTTMAALALLEDNANRGFCRERVYRHQEDVLAQDDV